MCTRVAAAIERAGQIDRVKAEAGEAQRHLHRAYVNCERLAPEVFAQIGTALTYVKRVIEAVEKLQ